MLITEFSKTKKAWIDLRQQANFWKAQHAKTIKREAIWRAKVQELEETLRQQIRNHNAQIKDSEENDTDKNDPTSSEDSDKNDSGKKRPRGQQEDVPGHGRRLRTNLPSVDVFHDLKDHEKQCQICNLPFCLIPITQDSEDIHYELRLVRRRHKRKCYLRTCQCKNVPKIITAPPPAKLIPKGMFSTDFWVHILAEKLRPWAQEWINRIGELFHLNDKRLEVLSDNDKFQVTAQVLRKAMDSFQETYVNELESETHHSIQRKTLESLRNHWSGLLIFVDHPEIPMDNNISERALRELALGRKNYYGCASQWSGDLTAALFTIFQTARLNYLHPKKFLKAYLEACA